jgi:hypothetical protein
MEKLITHDMLADLGNNIRVAYKFLHPNGLSMDELAEKANEHDFYRGVYRYIKRRLEE